MPVGENDVPALQVGEKRHALFPEAEVVIEDIDHVPVDDTVSVYFRQMAGEPLLTAGQEVMLAKRIERGREAQKRLGEKTSIASEEVEVLEDIIKDAQAAREHLSRANTRLVVSIAKRYRNQGLPLSDLIQEGNVGLMITIDKYDYRLGNRFSTYASWWIRQSITRALSQKSRTIRLPLHLSGQLRRITTVNQIMGQELGREPSDEELAARLDMNPAEIREALEADPQIIALEMPIGDGSEFGDLIEDEGSTNPDDTMRKIILREVLDRIINELMPREARIIRLRFGLEDGSPQTLEEIGQALGLSRERIRQIERQVLHRLRQPHFAHRLQELIV